MKQFALLIKPSGPDCNIACQYCFYARKKQMFGKTEHAMNMDVLEKLIRDYMSLNFETSSFAWQGGEPTLMGLDFYKKVVKLQIKYGSNGRKVSNALQSNGILLDERWCEFLAEYNFLVGISLDGTKELHDYYRVGKSGEGTFDKVVKAIQRCKKYNVQYNVLTLLNQNNVEKCDDIFNFFINHGIKFWQFIPCAEVDAKSGRVTDFSITPEQYGRFLCRLLDKWLEHDPKKISIRMFESLISYCVSGSHTICTFNRSCDDYIVVEHNGDAFCCDFFVEKKWRCGNIIDTHVRKLFNSNIKKKFAKSKHVVEDKCFLCRYKALCQGGCLKDRIVIAGRYDSSSYFCESYKQFFDYAMPKINLIAAEIQSGQR